MLLTGPHRKVKAFTFLEILIVVTLLLVITTLAIPRFRHSYDSLILNSYADRFERLVRSAHELSMVEGKIYKIVVNDENATFRLLKESSDAELLFSPIRGIMGREQQMPSGSHIESTSDEIYFYPRGESTECEIIFSLRQLKSIQMRIDLYGRVIES